jgi:hypothetical protein
MTTSTNLEVVNRDINVIGEVGVELIDGMLHLLGAHRRERLFPEHV